MKVKFVPQDVEFDIKPNETVLHVAQDHGVYIKSVCKGVPSCAECRVRITEGHYNVIQPSAAELALIGSAYFVDGRRLSCQLRCFGDITLDMSEQIQKQEQVKRPRGTAKGERNEMEESRAILGNFMGQEADAAKPFMPVDADDGELLAVDGESNSRIEAGDASADTAGQSASREPVGAEGAEASAARPSIPPRAERSGPRPNQGPDSRPPRQGGRPGGGGGRGSSSGGRGSGGGGRPNPPADGKKDFYGGFFKSGAPQTEGAGASGDAGEGKGGGGGSGRRRRRRRRK